VRGRRPWCQPLHLTFQCNQCLLRDRTR
jgi:hypothetical protein